MSPCALGDERGHYGHEVGITLPLGKSIYNFVWDKLQKD